LLRLLANRESASADCQSSDRRSATGDQPPAIGHGRSATGDRPPINPA
jgi:hypothetical protein